MLRMDLTTSLMNTHPYLHIDLKTKPICCLINLKTSASACTLATMTDNHMTDVYVTVCVRFVLCISKIANNVYSVSTVSEATNATSRTLTNHIAEQK